MIERMFARWRARGAGPHPGTPVAETGPSGDKPRERGVALIMVLWILVILTVVVGSVTQIVRSDLEMARNARDRAQGEAILEGAVYRAIAGLQEAVDDGGWQVAGAVYAWKEGDAEVRVTAEDEGGKIDLNGAEVDLLSSLFRAAGVDAGEADALADAVADFRDEDNLQQLNGAEDRDYEDAGLDFGAKDLAFESVEELRQVYGMSPALFTKVADSLTVFSAQSAPFRPTSPPLVKAAMSAFAEEQGELLDEDEEGFEDEDGEFEEDEDFEEDGLTGGFGGGNRKSSADRRTESAGDAFAVDVTRIVDGSTEERSQIPIYKIHVEVRLPGGTLVAQDVVARVIRSRRQPFTIFRWQQGRSWLFDDAIEGAEGDDNGEDGGLFDGSGEETL